ncbi:WD40 repeat domain-containing protein [Dactylosporangium sp. NPDC048998]|uniref:WD40 repeat domain-containing protein n=1 Tax=Dactylosporangium sp. NPDC048998 TaxID=3363976 RepID=UPI0037245B8D
MLRHPDVTTLARAVFSEDGSLIAGIDVDRSQIQVWDAVHGGPAATVQVPEAGGGLAFGNLSQLAIGTRDHIVFRDVETGAEVAPPLDHPGKIRALAYNGNRSWLVSGSDNGTVVVWDLTHQPARRLATLTVPGGGSVVEVATTGDGRLVAAAGLDNRAISLWQLPYGTSIGEPVTLHGRASAVAFSPDGMHLAAGGNEGLLLIDTATGTPLCPPSPYSSQSIAYHRTGRLASAGTDGKVRLWENDDALAHCDTDTLTAV